jgi:NADH-quinone oxidoreductase subunit H
MALTVASPLLLVNTLSLRTIVNNQAGWYFGIVPKWSIFQGPWPQIFAFILFLIAAFAETNRVPFDLPEAENELVAGFHTEYGSMKFAAFFMAEYANMVTVACMGTLLFLGGWYPLWDPAYGSNYLPPALFVFGGLIALYAGLNPARKLDRYTLPVAAIVLFITAGVFFIPVVAMVILPLFWFGAKVGAILFLYIWIRGTLPRFRYDQLMHFAWVFMFPVAMANLLITGLLVALTTK